jgi:hypothetical protein
MVRLEFYLPVCFWLTAASWLSSWTQTWEGAYSVFYIASNRNTGAPFVHITITNMGDLSNSILVLTRHYRTSTSHKWKKNIVEILRVVFSIHLPFFQQSSKISVMRWNVSANNLRAIQKTCKVLFRNFKRFLFDHYLFLWQATFDNLHQYRIIAKYIYV